MWYEINISLNGTHFFATHKRSLTTERDVIRLLQIFKTKFPESENYRISVTKLEQIGKDVTKIFYHQAIGEI